MENEQNNKVVSVGDWVLSIFLTAIPMVGLIMLIIWAVSKDIPESKSNWAKGMLAWYGITIVLAILFGGALLAFVASQGAF